MFHAADALPEALGAKLTLAVQVADAARLEPQVVELIANSAALAPERDCGLRVTAPEVVFDTVMVCAALVDPVLTLPKDRVPGAAVTLPAGALPRPVTDTS
jgi:hypothetical protein